MSWWDTKKSYIYKNMYRNHGKLWKYIREFLAENHISSIFEIGGGMYSPVKNLCTDYIDIDLNAQIPGAIYADFTKLDVTPYKDKFDLCLAAAVIEHCPGYEDFLANVVKLNPKFALITFFTGLNREVDITEQIKFHNEKIWRNHYSKDGVIATLKELGVDNYRIFTASTADKDTVLLIDFRS